MKNDDLGLENDGVEQVKNMMMKKVREMIKMARGIFS